MNEILIRLGVTGQAQVIGAFNNLSMAAGRLRAVMGALAGIAGVGVLAEFTRQAINTADQMGKLAQKTGILTEELSALTFAAKLGDLEQGEFATALKFLGQEMAQTGIKGKSLQERLFEIADQFQKMPDGVAKNEIALKNFGRAGLDMVPFLNQGSEAIRRQSSEAEKFGLIISDRFAENADEFNDNMERLKASLHGFFLQLADRLLPALIKLQEWFLEFTSNVELRETVLAGLLTVIKHMATFAAGLAYEFQQLALVMRFLTSEGNDGGKAWFEYLEAAGEAERKFTELVLTLDKIGETQDDVTESTKKTTAAYVTLASRMQTLKAMLASEKTKFGIDSGGSGFMTAAKAKVLKDDVAAQLEIIKQQKAALGPDPSKEMAFFANDANEAVYSQKQIEYQTKLNALLKEESDLKEQDTKINLQRLASQQKYAEGLSASFGNLAATAKAFGKKGFAAAKAFGIAQAIVDTYKAANAAFAWGTEMGTPILGAIFAATAVAAGLANVATISATEPQGYAAGGYTGPGPRFQPAGMAHKGEFIFSQPDVQRYGLPALEEFRATGRGVASAPPNVTTVVFFDRSKMRDWLRDRMVTDEILKIVEINKMSLGIA